MNFNTDTSDQADQHNEPDARLFKTQDALFGLSRD